MKVVLDTNVICANYRLDGGAFRVLFDALPRIGHQCFLPEVVLDEVLAVYRRHLDEAAAKIQQLSKEWSRLTGEPLPAVPAEAEIETSTGSYLQLLTRQLERHDITVLPYPNVSHQILVTRAASQRRPFDQKGRGYRDALVWTTLLALGPSEEEPIALVTGNSRDFGTAPTLHPDLAAELKSTTAVELYNTLEEFNVVRVIPHLKHLDKVLRALENDSYQEFSLKTWLIYNLQGALHEGEVGCCFVGLEPSHGSAWVSEVKEQHGLIVDDVRLLPSEDLLVLANVDVKVEVSVSADWDDCERYEDIRAFFGGDCSGHPTAWVEGDGNVAFTLSLKRDSSQVLWCEIDEIRSVDEVQINPHPRRGEP